MISGIPYWRLAAVYLGYFGVIGGLSPYWAAYLSHLGFAPQTIGLLVAIPMITRLLAPYLWGMLADATAKHLAIARLGAVASLVSFSVLVYVQSFWAIFAATFVFSFFWNAILPQFEGLTLGHLGERSALYSRVRVWGSIGFIVMVLALGVVFDYTSLSLLPQCLVLAIALVVIAAFVLPAPVNPSGQKIQSSTQRLWPVLRKPTVMSFFVVVFLLQISHGVYYGFYTLYLQEQGYSSTLISGFWTLGVIGEIILFLYIPKIFARFSLRQCLLLALAIATVRWALIGLGVQNLWLLALAQLGHAFTFGMVHAVAMAFMRQYFTGALQGRGQALYSAVSFGAGAALGTYLAGWLWLFGGLVTFILAAIVACMAFFVALYAMPKSACQ